jgi:hypothetical protein
MHRNLQFPEKKRAVSDQDVKTNYVSDQDVKTLMISSWDQFPCSNIFRQTTLMFDHLPILQAQ